MKPVTPAPPSPRRSSEKAAALIIVLAFVVLLTGVAVAYLSRSTTDRQLAHTSFHDTAADVLARSALDTVIGDFRWEIVDGSTTTTVSGTTIYTPADTGSGAAANMVPQRSGTAAGAPNLIRRSIRLDPIPTPGHPSRAAAVSSAPSPSATPNRGEITKARWNKHYLIPKLNTGDDGTEPIAAFTAPDWVFVSNVGPFETPAPSLVIGRYAYAVYDEGGLLDMNVAGYPNDTSAAPVPAQRVGRKGSLAYADLTALGNYPIPNGNPYQVDKLVGWRNYATTHPDNKFPDPNFAANFQSDATRAAAYFTSIINNTTGFLTASTPPPWNNRTDQMFVQRQELIAYRAATDFSANALQYLSTFSRESNAPSFSPLLNASEMGGNDQGGTYAYRTNAADPAATPINPNFLYRRVPSPPPSFKRFDGTNAAGGEPLVKTRFPLSRLAWITYKGPSGDLYTANPNDPIITALLLAGVPVSTIQAGTAANVKYCFGLVFGGAVGDASNPWIYTNPGGSTAASRILRLDEVVALNPGREADFFELLQAGILSGSLGQSTAPPPGTSGSGTTGGNVFPDVHMSSTIQHLLTIGACTIDQADPDSIPTRIQFLGTNGNTWTTYGAESLPYIAQIYPITGTSPTSGHGTQWATYLLFQLWNPHVGGALPTPAPQVRLRVDGNIGIFSGGNGETWTTFPLNNRTCAFPSGGVSLALTAGAFPQTLPTPNPSPFGTPGVVSVPAVDSATAPGGFERLSGTGVNSLTNYVGLRLLPDYTLTSVGSGNNPQLNLYLGTDAAHPFSVTMEWTPDGGTTWIPYNRFVGIDDSTSWINGDTVPVRNSNARNGRPASGDAFGSGSVTRLRDFPLPDCLMKADPRATRFGIFQFKQALTSATARISDPLWPTGNTNYANGYGGVIADPAGPVEHAPNRFVGLLPYFPATLCINNGASTSTRTGYADNDGVIRPADAANTEAPATGSSTGSATPYYATTTAGSADYHPVILNRPLRNVAELGYVFRDLPWKTLDFFTDKSADGGLLDIFCIHDGPQSATAYNGTNLGNVVPAVVAGKVNLDSVYLDPNDPTLVPVGRPILAGGIWDEIASSTVLPAGSGDQTAQTMTSRLVNATTTTPMQNKSELITRSGLPTTILPLPGAGVAAHPQRVKTQREVVARAMSSVSQTRVWNLLIDMVAQSGHFKPGAVSLQNDFVVEGEQHYWAHVAVDRFTGQVIDKQVEVVTE